MCYPSGAELSFSLFVFIRDAQASCVNDQDESTSGGNVLDLLDVTHLLIPKKPVSILPCSTAFIYVLPLSVVLYNSMYMSWLPLWCSS